LVKKIWSKKLNFNHAYHQNWCYSLSFRLTNKTYDISAFLDITNRQLSWGLRDNRRSDNCISKTVVFAYGECLRRSRRC